MSQKLTSIFLAGLLLVVLFPQLSFAQTNNPFGGLVVSRIPCLCSFNALITVIPAKDDLPNNLILDATSILYAFFQVEPGQQILGTWEGVETCKQPGFPFACLTPIVTVYPRIYMVGTSGGKLPPTKPPEPQKPECSDGKDNDGDGKIDYPADPGCTSASDNSEADPQCSDGKDNDNDGKIDYPADPQCDSPQDNSESGDQCPCGCDAKNEQDTRNDLANIGIPVNKGPCPRNDPNNACASTPTGTSGGRNVYSCTDVRCLPSGAINTLGRLKQLAGCNNGELIVTGGTEPGHQSHGQCLSVVDLRLGSAPCLDNYIRTNASGTPHSESGSTYTGTRYTVPGIGTFLDEMPTGGLRHWHVQLN